VRPRELNLILMAISFLVQYYNNLYTFLIK
jgi:hypothetical protein